MLTNEYVVNDMIIKLDRKDRIVEIKTEDESFYNFVQKEIWELNNEKDYQRDTCIIVLSDVDGLLKLEINYSDVEHYNDFVFELLDQTMLIAIHEYRAVKHENSLK